MIYAVVLSILLLLAPTVGFATVNEVIARNDYTGDGSLTIYPYTFKVLTKNDLFVYKGANLQVVDVGYSVSGLGVSSGGNVTFVVAPLNGEHVTIIRDQPIQQLSDYQPNEPFPANRIELDYDKQTMVDQMQNEHIGRALRVQPYVYPFTTIVDPTGQAGKFVKVADDGTGFTFGVPSGGGGGGGPDLSGAPFVTVSLSSDLTSERVLAAGDGIKLTDGGVNSSLVVALKVPATVIDITDPEFGASISASGAVNRAAVQAVVDSARCPAGGCIIFAPGGGFTLDTTPIEVDRCGITFWGVGMHATAFNTPATTTDVFNLTATCPVNFRDLGIIFTGTATAGSAIHINPTAATNFGGSRFDNVLIRRAARGLTFEAGSEWVVSKMRFENLTVNGISIKNPNSLDYGENKIANTVFSAVDTTPDTHIEFYSGGGLRISGSKFLQANIAIAVLPPVGVNTSILQFVNNSCENFVTHCIQFQDSAGTMAYANISSNEFGLQAGSRSAITVGTSGLQIMVGGGNTFHFFSDAAGPRSGVTATNGATDVFVDGNLMISEGGGGTTYGVEILGTATVGVGKGYYRGITTEVIGTPTLQVTSGPVDHRGASQAAIRLFPYSVSAGGTAEVRFFELFANGSNYTALKAPDSIAANWAITLPSAPPGAKFCLNMTTGGVIEYAVDECGTGAGGGSVDSVVGTSNRITSSGGTDPIIDISASYVGQASITTLGTVTTGTWNVPAGSVTAATGVFKTSTTVGTASSVAGLVVFQNATNANTTTLQSGSAASITITLPTSPGINGDCMLGNGGTPLVLSMAACAGGGAGTITAIDGQAGPVITIVDDTNVTVVGAANNLTMTWVGTLSAARGGFGADMSAATGIVSFNAGARVVSNVLGTAGRVLYADSTNAVGSNASLAWDNVNKVLNLNANATAMATGPTGTLMRVAGLDAVGVYMTIDSYGTGSTASGYLGRRSRGTAASKTAVQADDVLVTIGGIGYGASTHPDTPSGALGFFANQTHTDSARGTFFTLATTPNASVTLTERFRVTADGRFGFNVTPVSGTTIQIVGPASSGQDTITFGPGQTTNTDGLNIGHNSGLGLGKSFLNAHSATSTVADFRMLVNGTTVLTLTNNKGVDVGAPSGPAGGIVNSINVQGDYYKNGVLIGAIGGSCAAAGRVTYWSATTTQACDSVFTWDATNHFLGIGITTPLYPLHIVSTLTPTTPDANSTLRMTVGFSGNRAGVPQAPGINLVITDASTGTAGGLGNGTFAAAILPTYTTAYRGSATGLQVFQDIQVSAILVGDANEFSAIAPTTKITSTAAVTTYALNPFVYRAAAASSSIAYGMLIEMVNGPANPFMSGINILNHDTAAIGAVFPAMNANTAGNAIYVNALTESSVKAWTYAFVLHSGAQNRYSVDGTGLVSITPTNLTASAITPPVPLSIVTTISGDRAGVAQAPGIYVAITDSTTQSVPSTLAAASFGIGMTQTLTSSFRGGAVGIIGYQDIATGAVVVGDTNEYSGIGATQKITSPAAINAYTFNGFTYRAAAASSATAYAALLETINGPNNTTLHGIWLYNHDFPGTVLFPALTAKTGGHAIVVTAKTESAVEAWTSAFALLDSDSASSGSARFQVTNRGAIVMNVPSAFSGSYLSISENSVAVAQIDDSASTNETPIVVTIPGIGARRLVIGGADSCTSGFRCVRIVN